MVPVFELRGAMLYGIPAGVPVVLCYVICVVGNLVPIPFLIMFTRKVFDWLKTKGKIGTLVDKLEAKAHTKSEIVQKYEWWGLCILVAIPQTIASIELGGLIFLLLGGVAYTIGAAIYAIGKKMGRAYVHGVFHLFVVLGSLLQFFCILFYVM